MHSKRENGTGCGWEHSQSYTVVDGDLSSPQGATISMRELNATINGQYKGDIPCSFNNRGTQSYLSGVNVGEQITWYTDYGWNWEAHTGTVKYIDDSHPNRS